MLRGVLQNIYKQRNGAAKQHQKHFFFHPSISSLHIQFRATEMKYSFFMYTADCYYDYTAVVAFQLDIFSSRQPLGMCNNSAKGIQFICVGFSSISYPMEVSVWGCDNQGIIIQRLPIQRLVQNEISWTGDRTHKVLLTIYQNRWELGLVPRNSWKVPHYITADC